MEKLFLVCLTYMAYDDYNKEDIVIVVAKSKQEAEENVLSTRYNDDLINCCAEEIDEVDGYKIILEKAGEE